MPGDSIVAAAETEAEIVRVESSAVVAAAAAESAVVAAETAVAMVEAQSAIVEQQAAEVIAEHVEQVEILEGSLEWLREQMVSQNQASQLQAQALALELQTMREQIALLTLSQIMETESTPTAESLSSTPPDLAEVTEVVTAEAVPSQSAVVDAPLVPGPDEKPLKKKRLNLL